MSPTQPGALGGKGEGRNWKVVPPTTTTRPQRRWVVSFWGRVCDPCGCPTHTPISAYRFTALLSSPDQKGSEEEQKHYFHSMWYEFKPSATAMQEELFIQRRRKRELKCFSISGGKKSGNRRRQWRRRAGACEKGRRGRPI